MSRLSTGPCVHNASKKREEENYKNREPQLRVCVSRLSTDKTCPAQLLRRHEPGLCNRPPEGCNLLRKPPFSSLVTKQKKLRATANAVTLNLVEVTRLELAASASRTQRSTKLSHTSIQMTDDRFHMSDHKRRRHSYYMMSAV